LTSFKINAQHKDLNLNIQEINNTDIAKITRTFQKNILSDKRFIFPKKINKTIEIITIPKLNTLSCHQKNIGITIDENLILNILTKHYSNVSITEITSKHDLLNVAIRKPDLIFSGVKYFYFKDKIVWLNDFLDDTNISYIGSNRQALDNEHDKSIAKKIMQNAHIKTAEFFTTENRNYLTEKSIPISFPVFIKPLMGGDSIGIDKNSIAYSFSDYQKKILDIKNKQKSYSMIETYLPGKEYTVSILHDSSNGFLKAMPIEITVERNINGDFILDYDIKKNDSEIVLKVLDKKINDCLCEFAKDAFKVLEGRSFGRIDIKMDSEGIPHFIEANLMPGLGTGYFYRSCLLNLNMTYEQMILTITNNGLGLCTQAHQ